MHGLELLGVSIVVFVAYLYLPAAMFRFGAEHSIDLQRRPDGNDIEDFITASIPSTAMHAATWFLLRGLALCRLLSPGKLPVVDWPLIASMISGEEKWHAFRTISRNPYPTIGYLGALLAVSAALGLMYGRSVLNHLTGSQAAARLPAPPEEWWPRCGGWLLTIPHRMAFVLGFGLAAFRELLFALNYAAMNLVLHESAVWMFRWSVHRPTVFVRTKSNRLYFGTFDRYEKRRNGDIDSIVITHVRRYCYDEVDKTIAEGRLPFAWFGGSLRLMWDEVADIHDADLAHYLRIEERYTKQRLIYLAATLLEQFEGETVSFDDICRRRLGGDRFDINDVTAALRSLVRQGVVSVATGDVHEAYGFPIRFQQVRPGRALRRKIPRWSRRASRTDGGNGHDDDVHVPTETNPPDRSTPHDV